MYSKYQFLKNKKILVTGHTGFIGAWLCLMLILLGAKLSGISLPLTNSNKAFKLFNLKNKINSYFFDIREYKKLEKTITSINPNIIIHLAAQPIVIDSHKDPIKTIDVNIKGTANLLMACLKLKKLKNIIIFTSDKVYANNNLSKFYYSEEDKLGGDDIYSSSKAAQDIISYSFFKSFYSKKKGLIINTIRSGNIFGGLDFGNYRLVPDLINFIKSKKKNLYLRNPNSTRPWQHVFEPCYGIIKLIIYNSTKNKTHFNSYNFAPKNKSQISVIRFSRLFLKNCQKKYKIINRSNKNIPEKKYLALSGKKSLRTLNFKNMLNLEESVRLTTEIYFSKKIDLIDNATRQIKDYLKII